MTTITVLDSTGATQTVAKVAATGSTTSANSLPVVIASDQGTFPVTASIASAQTLATVTTVGTVTTITNAVTTTPFQNTSTDKSGTITTGGTAQNVFAGSASTKGWDFTNLSSVMMYLTDTGTAATATTGILVAPNQTATDAGHPTANALSVFCATTSSAFAARQYT